MLNTALDKQCMSEIANVSPYVHVVAAAIIGPSGQVLITQRASNVHQGGRWEFPGGKVEQGENSVQALCRELYEELGITPLAYQPLIRTRYEYPDKRVVLEVWRVDRYEGIPEGREGQPLRWTAVAKLGKLTFPQANIPIVTALKIPERYLITPDPGADWQGFLIALDQALAQGLNLLRLRANSLSDESYADHASQVIERCHEHGARVLIDREPERVIQLGADGLHITSRFLMRLNARPLGSEHLICASCHNCRELVQANQINADFAVLSPVKSTASHPGAAGLGWDKFEQLCDVARMPVYALGGMRADDIARARRCGGQGIAAIRSLWPGKAMKP